MFTSSAKFANLMLVPVGENKGKEGGALVVIMQNKYAIDEEGNFNYVNFSATTSPTCNKVFQLTFVNTLACVAMKKTLQEEVLMENLVFKTIDRVMAVGTMYEFCKAIEDFFRELFHCERVNVVLVHRIKQHQYRIEKDEVPGTYKFVTFDLYRGIAGFAANHAQTIVTESVQEDLKFFP